MKRVMLMVITDKAHGGLTEEQHIIFIMAVGIIIPVPATTTSTVMILTGAMGRKEDIRWEIKDSETVTYPADSERREGEDIHTITVTAATMLVVITIPTSITLLPISSAATSLFTSIRRRISSIM